MILESVGGGSFMSNCYIVGSESTGDGMVIDPSAKIREILRTARKAGLSIKLIVATHAHPDHVASLTQLWDGTGAEFLIHEDEETKGMMQSFGRLLGLMQGGSLRALPRPDRLLRDGDTVQVGDLNFSVMHTPGHTAGGICLAGNGVLFSGDTLFNTGIGRTDLPGMSYSLIMRSICDKLMTFPDETKVYPGHGPATTIGFERVHNPFLQDWMQRGE